MKIPKITTIVSLVLTLGTLVTACNPVRQSKPETYLPVETFPTSVAVPIENLDSAPITRPRDPVILTGADFPEFLNFPISELKLYATNGFEWSPIPFQVDEVDSTGTVVAPGTDDDDGGLALLDANDQVVFMGHDAGTTASCAASLELVPETHVRETVTITDTLNGESGTVYLYQTTSLPISPESYVDWDQATQTITGTYQNHYVATFGGAKDPQFLGLADLYVNGSSDIVDRQKLRLDLDLELLFGVCIPVSCSFSEEGSSNSLCNQFWTEMEPYLDLQFPSVGPVRAVNDQGFSFYGSKYEAGIVIPFSALDEYPNICPGTIDVSLFRIATDLNDPVAHGVDTYFDNNASSATIDGIADQVPPTPLIGWYQTSGGDFGGVVTALHAIYPDGVTASTHYVDDSASGGTGDGASYGEAGIEFTNAGADDLGVQLSTYILPPGTTENLGATYKQYATTPLTAVTRSDTCELSAYPVYLPIVLTSGGN